jgi:hypothetical protein
MGKRRWGKRLCRGCGHELSASQGSKETSPGNREVRWHCKRCGARFKSQEAAFDACYHAAWEWIADDQGRPFLQLDVEGWPILTRLCIQRLEKPTRVAPWQAVTPSGERLAGLEVTNGGPLDRLIVALINQRLDALNRGEEIAPSVMPHLRPGQREKTPEMGWAWQPFGYGVHHLTLTLDGWPVEVGAYLLEIHRDPESGVWQAITASGERVEHVEGLPGGAVGDVVAQLYNERLAFLRVNDAALVQVTPRGG